MLLRENIVIALKRKSDELNLSTIGLSDEVNVSRWTLDNIFKRGYRKVTPATYKKLSDWLIDQYLDDDMYESKKAVMAMPRENKNSDHCNGRKHK